jgi:hypothetical protein
VHAVLPAVNTQQLQIIDQYDSIGNVSIGHEEIDMALCDDKRVSRQGAERHRASHTSFVRPSFRAIERESHVRLCRAGQHFGSLERGPETALGTGDL